MYWRLLSAKPIIMTTYNTEYWDSDLIWAVSSFDKWISILESSNFRVLILSFIIQNQISFLSLVQLKEMR